MSFGDVWFCAHEIFISCMKSNVRQQKTNSHWQKPARGLNIIGIYPQIGANPNKKQRRP
jgi:hypothetical protein